MLTTGSICSCCVACATETVVRAARVTRSVVNTVGSGTRAILCGFNFLDSERTNQR